MRALIQRVKKGSVEVDNKIISTIDQGIVLFIGIENADTNLDIEWICKKVSQLRIFDDENKIMNKSLMDIRGDLLVISQFTLHALTKKGNRPSYSYHSILVVISFKKVIKASFKFKSGDSTTPFSI